jgi:hypothetical protein
MCGTAGVASHAALEPTLQAATCSNALVGTDPKTLDQMCDIAQLACSQEKYAALCPSSLSHP